MIEEVVEKVEKEIQTQFQYEEVIEYHNSKKVLNVFKKYSVSEAHLQHHRFVAQQLAYLFRVAHPFDA